MKSLVLLLFAASSPTESDTMTMFSQSDSFMKVCAPAFESKEPTEDQEIAQGLCASFALGVGSARAMASKYELDGVPICAREARARDVLRAAFTLYRTAEEVRQLNPAALLVVAQARSFPCR